MNQVTGHLGNWYYYKSHLHRRSHLDQLTNTSEGIEPLSFNLYIQLSTISSILSSSTNQWFLKTKTETMHWYYFSYVVHILNYSKKAFTKACIIRRLQRQMHGLVKYNKLCTLL